MPYINPKVTPHDVEQHYKMGTVLDGAPELEAAKSLAADGKLKLECSSFKDPGEDYTALLKGSKRITYWAGY